MVAVEQVRRIVLALCAQAAADPGDYVRHFRLVEQHVELRARDELKMQQFAGRLSEVLIHRGAEQTIAVTAAHVALGCYLTAKSLGNDPQTLVDDVKAAFARVLALGAETTPG